MKIIFVIKTLAHVKGGAERVLTIVANGLAEKPQYDVQIVTFDEADAKPTYPVANNVKLTCLGVGDVGKKSTIEDVFKRILLLRKTLKRESPTVVIPFMSSAFVPTSLAMLFMGNPVIASEHSIFKENKWSLILSSFLVKKTTCVSEVVKKTFPYLVRRKMHSIPNPLSPELFGEIDEKKNNERKRFLSVGRLEEPKDFATLIFAFDLIAKDLPEWDLYIYGEGSLRDVLEGMVRKFKLESRVFLPGTLERIQVAYSNADIFVSSSRYESFGLAAAEAMALEVPCVGFSECTGINEIVIHNQNGLLVEGIEDPEALAEQMKYLAKNDSIRATLGKYARDSVQKFRAEAIVQQWVAILEETSSK